MRVIISLKDGDVIQIVVTISCISLDCLPYYRYAFSSSIHSCAYTTYILNSFTNMLFTIQGGAAFGDPNMNTTRIHTLPEAQAVVDLYIRLGYQNIDESNTYGNGSSEEV